VASTAFEWVSAFLSAAFFASYTKEFSYFTVAMPVEFTVANLTGTEVKVTEKNGIAGHDTVTTETFHISTVSQ
jgi:hypothetical protein